MLVIYIETNLIEGLIFGIINILEEMDEQSKETFKTS